VLSVVTGDVVPMTEARQQQQQLMQLHAAVMEQ